MNPFLIGLAKNRYRRIICEPHPKRWTKFCNDFHLNWQAVPFRRGGAAVLPQAAGFYCFFVGEPPAHLPRVLFPLYAGETVDLRRRYQDYVREKNNPDGRIPVREMLHVFSGEVGFAYALFAGERPERLAIEKQLNDALMPWYGTKDFSADVKRGRRPWP